MDIQLRQLAEDAHQKSEMFRALGMMNISSDPNERLKQNIRYRIAKLEWITAEQKFLNAINESAISPP